MVEEVKSIVDFVKELEQLKDITRTSWTKSGRRESVAEHSWRLAVFGMILEGELEHIDFNRVIKLCLVHDLGEAYDGDVSATIEIDHNSKLQKEENALNTLLKTLSENKRLTILELWKEYNDGITNESKLVKALDKLETIIQHNQGNNPQNFDYEFNIEYGKRYSTFNPFIECIREIVDKETYMNVKNTKRKG